MIPSLVLIISQTVVSALVPSLRPIVALRRLSLSTSTSPTSPVNKSSLFSTTDDNGEEAHLQGISVGIDLGTTNSAVAMMIPSDDRR